MNIETQAKQDKLNAEAQMQRDSTAESEIAKKERADNRRRRAMIEASYAKSGVLLDGSAADVLTKQREVDEVNVQNIHVEGGNQMSMNQAKAAGDYSSSLYAASATRSAAKTSLFGDLLSTAGSSMGAYSGGGGDAGTPTSTAKSSTSSSSSSFQPGSSSSSSSSDLGKADPSIWFSA